MLLKKIVGNRLKKNTQKVAFSGISTGLCVAVIFFGSLLDIIDVSTAALAGIVILISIYKTDIRYSLAIYFASSVLSVLLVSQKTAPVFFSLIFGSYPFIWYYSSKIKKIIVSYLIKILFFNALLLISVFLIKELIASYIDEPTLILIALIILVNIVFLLYDYVFSILWFNMTGFFYGTTFPLKFLKYKK